MSKKVISVLLLCILLICSFTSAFAATNRYCPSCNATTQHFDGCSNYRAYATGNVPHTINGSVCNAYDLYYKNKQTCHLCGSTYVSNDVVHWEAEMHDVCGGKRRCPF